MYKYAIINPESMSLNPVKKFDNREQISEYITKWEKKADEETLRTVDPLTYLIMRIDTKKPVKYGNFIMYSSHYSTWHHLTQKLESGEIDEADYDNSYNELVYQEKRDIKSAIQLTDGPDYLSIPDEKQDGELDEYEPDIY